MKYAVEMGSDNLICSFMKIGLSIQKLISGIERHTDSMVIS
jgi:hypothetical protein